MSPKIKSLLYKLALGFIPLILVWGVDFLTKIWAMRLNETLYFGPLYFKLVFNHGVIMGLYSQLPLLAKTVTLTTLGAAVLSTYALVVSLVPIKSLYLRVGLSVLVGGIIGNVTDRFIHNAVVDFIALKFNNHSTPILNMADIGQWIGYICILIGLYKDYLYYWPTEDWRNKFFVNPGFQIRTGLILGLIGFVTGFIILVFGMSFFQEGPGSINLKFYLIFGSALIVFLSSAVIFLGIILSHRVAGPIFALKRYLDASAQGKHFSFKLRENDEFKELEIYLTMLSTEMQRLYEIERECNGKEEPPPLPVEITSLEINKKVA